MSIQKMVKAIASALPTEFMMGLKVNNLAVVSERTVRFDIPATAKGINRIKVTMQPNGEFRVRTYKVEEVEDVPNVEPGCLQGAIKALAGIESNNKE